MTLQDLSDSNRRILLALFQATSAGRRRLADMCQIEVQKISRNLNRLEGFGFVEKTDEPLREWRLSKEGAQLFGTRVPIFTVTAPPVEPADPMPEDPPAVEPVVTDDPPPLRAVADDHELNIAMDEIIARMADEQELNIAMDEIIARIRAPRIPAASLRAYRRLIGHLPDLVQQALAPITALVEMQP